MTLPRFIFYLFVLIGVLAASSVFVLTIGLMLRFPPLLVVVVLSGGFFARLLKRHSRSPLTKRRFA